MGKYTDNKPSFVASPNAVITAQAAYLFEDSSLSSPVKQRKSASKPWFKWGHDDNLPQDIFDRIAKNDSMLGAIETMAALILGDGVTTYKEVIDGDKKKREPIIVPEIEAFLETTKYNQLIFKKAWNTEFCANAFTLLKLNKLGQVVEVVAYDPQDVRAEFYNKNRIENYYVCGDFTKGKYTGNDEGDNAVGKFKSTAMLDLEGKNQGNFMHHSRYHLAGQKYYSFPRWWFGLEAWLELSNLIPRFQLAVIKNGIAPKYLLKIPEFIFQDCTDKEARDKMKQELIDTFEKQLAGADKAGKTIAVLKTLINDKEVAVELAPIKLENLDKMFLDTFDVSTRAISRGVGIDPKLAGMDAGGKLGSGSDTVQTYNFHLVKQAHKEEIMLEELYLIKKLNKWPVDVKFALEKRIFTTLDFNPKGQQNAI